jgi:hypothetical protein
MFYLVPASEPTIVSTIGNLLVLVIPAGVITFGLWSVYATARWANGQPVSQRRGVLKWPRRIVHGRHGLVGANPSAQRPCAGLRRQRWKPLESLPRPA